MASEGLLRIHISSTHFLVTDATVRSSICESLRSLAHSKCVDFNPAALRAVLKPENMSSSAQAKLHKYLHASFVCTFQVRFLLLPFPIISVAVWITVFARFDR